MRKKNKWKAGLLITLLAVSMTACKGKSEKNTQEIVDTVVQLQEIEAETRERENGQSTKESMEQDSQEDAEDAKNTGLYYGYAVLNDNQRKLYREIYRALTDRKEYVEVSTNKTEELNYVFNYVMNDHPELFYVDGYQYKKYSIGSTVTKLHFYGNYTMEEREIAQYNAQIEQKMAKISEQLPDTTDEYEVAKAAYEYIINTTQYDLNAPDNQNICSVFLHGRSVCQGYAKAYQYLLQKEGIQAVLVTGKANQDGHAWNLVKINGAYYYVDVTWGDASYILSESQEIENLPPINYDYLLVTTEDICETHQLDELYILPECTTTQDNYYVREGLFLTAYEETELERIFAQAYENGNSYVTVKCADEMVYAQVREKLLDEKRIFHFVTVQGEQLAYTENELQRTISFWI